MDSRTSNYLVSQNKKRRLNYGTYWQPLYILISKIFNFWEIPFIDDFIRLIDYDGIEHVGIEHSYPDENINSIAIASLEVDIFTHYVRYSKNGKYIYIHTQYFIFRNFVINIKDINIIFTKPIDLPTFESANTLTSFTPLHNKQIIICKNQLNIIKEQSTNIKNALDILHHLFNSLDN